MVSAHGLVINEIISSNAEKIADDDGNYSDWIELYNAGTETIELKGWALSDNYSLPFKWVFPERKLAPGQHLLVWASGKDRKPTPGDWVNGVKREVYSNISGTSIQNLLLHLSYPDNPTSTHLVSTRFEAPVNMADNYGQRMHGWIKAPATGTYTFWISSDDNGQLWLSTDENFDHLRIIAEVPGWTNSREWGKFMQQKSVGVHLEEGKYYYIMALMKEGGGGDNLAVGWQLPDGTLDRPVSGQHLFTKSTGYLHTNFSISAAGEEIILTNPEGERVDEVAPVEIPSDVSYGRKPDGNGSFGFFSEPTPGKPNTTESFSEALSAPVFSHEGGFYSNPFHLSLNSAQPGVTIIYSVDGSLPVHENLIAKTFQYLNQYRETPGSSAGMMQSGTFKSNIFTLPIEVNDRTGDPNRVSRISTTYNSNPWYFPSKPIDKAVVVKARAVKDGALASPVVSHTYFVRSGGSNPYSLPVISMSAQMDHLFDFNRGIYVAGKDFENWRSANPNAEVNGARPANYHRDGDEWEYPAYFEYFEESGRRALGQNIGFRLHGGWSRSHPLKSLRIYARNSYGEPYLNYPFFKSQSDSSYKRIILRNSGNDTWYTMLRDAAMQGMVSHMNFETQAHRPSVLFLNGEYWGVHNIRERFDKHYLARKFDVNEDQLDILENNSIPSEGDNEHYQETLNYINQNGLQDNVHYEYIKTRIDVTSYIDYMLSQIFLVNTDWPGNNVKYWRLKTPAYLPGAEPGKDGRWRWMMFDTDFGFGIYNANDFSRDMMTFATFATGTEWPNPAWSTFLFRKLLENESFKTAFIVRFTDQLNTALKPAVVRSVIDELQAAIAPEMHRHIERWKIPSSYNTWNNNVNIMRNFADQRPTHARNHLRQFFRLGLDYLLSVDVSDKNHGHVVVNTIPLVKETRGVSENPYPWTGTYFRKVPLRLEAVAAPGYEFVRWIPAVSGYKNPVIELSPDNNQHFIAVFQKSARTDEVVHYWNFNDTEKLLIPSLTLLSANLHPGLPSGGNAEITHATGQNFAGLNARFGDLAGSHLRVNNPLGVKLLFDLPTTGFSKIKFRYETRRSGQGAGTQLVEYSTNGTDYIEIKRITVKDSDPELVFLDFSTIDALSNNPNFKIRISFEQGNGGTAGNNRFDNITLEGVPSEGMNLPPVIATHPGDLFTVEETENISLSLTQIFRDPEGAAMTFAATARHSKVAEPLIESNKLVLNVKARGETVIQLTANDGANSPASLTFRIMVYPKAFNLSEGEFAFTAWDKDSPEMTYPENMIFLQSGKNDPDDNDLLEFAYYITPDEYGTDDTGNIGFPYRNISRTRINGLGENGISFINTGRLRDLGGALVALNTTGIDEFKAQWLTGTMLRNSRKYGMRLQYRIGYNGEFTDLPETVYEAAADGNTTTIGPHQLPAELAGHEYVQLLWRYHHIEGTSGARSQLRLDDIRVAARPDKPQVYYPLAGATATAEQRIKWAQVEGIKFYELQVATNSEFINPVVSVQGLSSTEHLMGNLANGMDYYIRVRAVNSLYTGDWSETVSFTTRTTSAGIVSGSEGFMQVYPNPFGEYATVKINLVAGGQVMVRLYDLTGKKLMDVYNGLMPSGEFTFRIDGSHLPAGTYILVCQTDNDIKRQKLVKHR
jgi:hypothetical protein